MDTGVLELKVSRPADRTGLPLRVELARFARLVWHLALANLKIKYQRSVLGFVWTLLNPLLIVATLTVLFSSVIRMPLEHYWAFLLSGFFAWNFVQHTINSGTFVLAQHAPMVKGMRIHSEALVLGTVFARAIEFMLELSLVLVGLLIFHHGSVPASLIVVPPLVALQVVLAIGIALPIAAVSVFFDDVQHSLPPLLLVLFYVSPVFYPIHLVAENLRPIYYWNPIARLLDLWHIVLYEGAMPTVAQFGTFAAVAFGVCAAGFLFFAKHKRRFAEVL